MATDAASRLAASRNLYPSAPERLNPLLVEGDAVQASIDIQEPLQLHPGESKTVRFSYRTGSPRSIAFSLSWHATEEDAELLTNFLQDTLLPSVTINPPYPRADTGAIQQGEVRLVAPTEMPYELLYGAMVIVQPGQPGTIVVQP